MLDARWTLRAPSAERPTRREATDLLANIIAELSERGIMPTSLNIIAHAVDRGADDRIAAAIAALISGTKES